MQKLTSRSAGFALVESMVTVVVVAFGLLGVAGLVSRSFYAEAEAMQRAQAAMLLQDMVTRIEGNRANVAAYVTGEPVLPAMSQPQLHRGQLIAS